MEASQWRNHYNRAANDAQGTTTGYSNIIRILIRFVIMCCCLYEQVIESQMMKRLIEEKVVDVDEVNTYAGSQLKYLTFINTVGYS